ncbi:zinc-dependent metalloprotease [Vibrio atypicus]|uniref:zinc-dependent metalloprotease n=1 Tax=Vibrio atypicus TaxID=558271 RepID=UPI001359D844|nr:zinc-dependent metalloprotease [Vibrio atypicus]
MIFKRLALTSAITAVLAGCGADDQDYDYVERNEHEIQVKDLKTDGRWIYAPTTGAAPRFAVTQFPFLQGMGRYVEVCFSQNGLEVFGYDSNHPENIYPKDSNGYCLPLNDANGNLTGTDDQVEFPHIMTIPGDFARYQCKEDSYGDCTNVEEVDPDTGLTLEGYRTNTHYTPKPSEAKALDINWDELYGLKDGISPVGTPDVLSWEFDPKTGVLNFELEQTFSVDWDKISRYMDWGALEEELAKGSFKSRFFYSLVHEDQVASADYKPILYPVGDENEIGFFATTTKKLDPITNKYNDVTYLNRFNPELESIEYYLSDNFFEEKNASLLNVTLETIDMMNQTLNVIDPNNGKPLLKIVNKTEAAGIHAGDLRYNVIQLVDEPLKNGLLGYGPSIAHPQTGEIIKAHVNQYSGVARTGVPFYWDNMARFYNRSQLADSGLSSRADSPDVSDRSEVQSFRKLAETAAMYNLDHSHVHTSVTEQEAEHLVELQTKVQSRLRPSDLVEVTDETPLEDVIVAEEQRLQLWSENNVYPIEASWVSASTKAVIDNLPLTDEGYFEIVKDEGGNEVTRTLKSWNELPDNLKSVAADAITETTYRNTLVHEIGHNVGLRHNFKGSLDSDNFLTREQADRLGIANIPAYSSTMDYAPSMLDEIPTWGLYDVAAFKFGYGRKVDLIKPSPVSAADLSTPAGQQAHADSFYGQYGPSPIVANGNSAPLIECTETQIVTDGSGQPTGDSVYTCDFSKLDQAALAGDARAEHGALYYLEDVLNIDSRKSYAFCTDGNVSLNSDCNRFDEGTTREEIVRYQWQNYLDSYDRRNVGLYSDGLYNSDYPSYIVRRFREMNDMRDMIEDSERIDSIFHDYGDASPSQKPTEFLNLLANNPSYCTYSEDPAVMANNSWLCDYAYGSKKAAEFFLDVLRTPESQCIITNRNDELVSVSLGESLNALSYMIPASYNLAEASCFDDTATGVLQSLHGAKEIHAEALNSKYLNSVASNDPANPYSNAVSILGMWPDKGLASYMLARRYSFRYTDEEQFASLLDLPGVKAEYDAIMAHLIAGEPLSNGVKFVDSDGVDYTIPASLDTNLHVTQLIESLPPMPSGIGSFFDLSSTARKDASTMILEMGTRRMRTDDVTFAETALAQRNSLSKQLDRYDMIQGDAIEVVIEGRTYKITKDNALANKFASRMVTSEGYSSKVALDGTSADSLDAVVAAWAPIAGFSERFHTPAAALDAPFVEAIINVYKAEIEAGRVDLSDGLSNAEFNGVIGAVLAQPETVFDSAAGTVTHNAGKVHNINDVVSIIDFTMAYVNSNLENTLLAAAYPLYEGYTNASDTDKFAWTLPLATINAYLTGDYANMIGEEYQILRKLPVHYVN